MLAAMRAQKEIFQVEMARLETRNSEEGGQKGAKNCGDRTRGEKDVLLTTRTVAATAACTCLVHKAPGTPCFFIMLFLYS